ncbi:MAG: response regulator, partial [Bryobacteraceae bacterium]
MAARVTYRPFEILLVEDEPADVRLAKEALKTGSIPMRLNVAGDGEDALKFLYREDQYSGAPRPDLILLDLNLPNLDGREVLKRLKADTTLKRIPVVVLTTSEAER